MDEVLQQLWWHSLPRSTQELDELMSIASPVVANGVATRWLQLCSLLVVNALLAEKNKQKITQNNQLLYSSLLRMLLVAAKGISF